MKKNPKNTDNIDLFKSAINALCTPIINKYNDHTLIANDDILEYWMGIGIMRIKITVPAV